MPNEGEKIIFVYNANSSLFAQVTDYAHKVISPDTYQCNLCQLTHGNMGMKKEWKDFVQKLPYESEFLHKDEFVKLYPNFRDTSFPAIFKEENGQISQLTSSEEINRQHTIKELEDQVLLGVNNK